MPSEARDSLTRHSWRGDVVGRGPTRAHWYSFCSAHRHHRDGCPACNAGTYINDWKRAADSLVYRRARRAWLWWHNRPNSATRRLLERHFPGLRDA